jgi:hypothetical protein
MQSTLRREEMKNVLFACVAILGLSGVNANAHEKVGVYFSTPRPVVVKSVSPCRVVGSFCRYGVGVGKRVFCGIGQVVTAPFKQSLVMPKPRTFIYVPSRWYYSPARVMEVSPMTVPKSHLGTPTPAPPAPAPPPEA